MRGADGYAFGEHCPGYHIVVTLDKNSGICMVIYLCKCEAGVDAYKHVCVYEQTDIT